jgi:hypothetical protein
MTSVGAQFGRLALGLLIIGVVWNLLEGFLLVAGIVAVWSLGGMILTLIKRFQESPQVGSPVAASAA